jgi:hypothetical protein
MKNTILGLMLALVLVVAPVATSALSTDDIQGQISSLLEQIKTLQAKLSDLVKQQSTSTKPTKVESTPQKEHRVCFLLSRNLIQGTTGDDVSGLQEFLNSEGYFTNNATGYFGPLTAQAVAKWQLSQGVESIGIVGPITRERIKIWCGGGVVDWKLRAEPQKGVAPLAVTFGANVRLTNNSMIADAGDYKIVFGDGSEHVFTCTDTINATCKGPHKTQHTYATNGTYTAKLIHYGYFGVPGPDGGAPQQILGEVKIYVGEREPVACTMEYNPVCGAKPIVCITTPCNPIPTTYGNKCAMNADGAKFLYVGECRVTPNPADDPKCKSWHDGCNTCSRSTPGGPAMCTLMACMQELMTTPYCKSYIDDSTTNKPPVISSFSGPTTLAAKIAGTWTIEASDPENQQLKYRVYWGDGYAYNTGVGAAFATDAFVQTTTFTHTYMAPGTYTVTIVVQDSGGQQAKTSTTVKVTGDVAICTMEYAPVCGQPPEPACRHSFPACMVPTPGPQTYSNRCMMNAAGATFISEGTCSTTY